MTDQRSIAEVEATVSQAHQSLQQAMAGIPSLTPSEITPRLLQVLNTGVTLDRQTMLDVGGTELIEVAEALSASHQINRVTTPVVCDGSSGPVVAQVAGWAKL